MLRVVIVEDEKHSRETLKNLLQEFCEGVEVVGMAGSVKEGIEQLNNTQPDVVFMDVELQPGTGFDVLQGVNELNFEIVFTTAFEQYAIKAIRFSSLDYLMKPIDLSELQQAIEKVKQKKDEDQYKQQLEVLMANFTDRKPEGKNICLSTAEGIEFVRIQEIMHCEASGSYTKFVFKDGKELLVSKHLKEYQQLLDEYDFMRVHNSFLINLREVKRFVKSEGGYILMNNDAMISISAGKRDEFMEKMLALG